MRPGRLIRVAQKLADLLGEGSALAGGLAVAAWGEIRATRDVDFVTSRARIDVERKLREHGIEFVARLGDPLSADLPWVLAGEVDGVPFQVFAPRGRRPFSVVDVEPETTPGKAVPVVSLKDLIRLKLEAGGSKDLWDVSRLLRRYGQEREAALACAESLGLGPELGRFLERP